MSREKRIEKMITDINEVQNGGWEFVGDSEYTTDVYNEELAQHLYNAGYRKQNNGKWVKDNNKRTCSLCGYSYYSNNDDFCYCPNCGAKMKGGAE